MPLSIAQGLTYLDLRFSGSIDLNSIGEVEARKIMSYEHKALGYRPPPGSLASQAQAEAAKHPKGGPSPPDPALLKKAALSDAAKIESERGHPIPKSTVVDGIDLSNITEGMLRNKSFISIIHCSVQPKLGSSCPKSTKRLVTDLHLGKVIFCVSKEQLISVPFIDRLQRVPRRLPRSIPKERLRLRLTLKF